MSSRRLTADAFAHAPRSATVQTWKMSIRHEQSERGGEFVLEIDGQRIGEITYTLAAGRLTVRHTGVDPAQEGRGYGKRLVAAAVDFARANGTQMASTCWFATRLLDRVPDFADVRAADNR